MTKKPVFDHTILVFIAFNCITLAMERPTIRPDSFERQFLTISNYIFSLVFTLEMLIKVIDDIRLYGGPTISSSATVLSVYVECILISDFIFCSMETAVDADM